MSASLLKYMIAAEALFDGRNGVGLTAIAEKAGVSKASAYHAVERLETDGYVRRDGKKKVLPTPKGLNRLNEYMSGVYALRDAFVKLCGVPGRVAFHEALKTVGVMSDECRVALTDFLNQNVQHLI